MEFGKIYFNDYVCKNFIEFFVEILKVDLSEKLNNVSFRFFLVMVDGFIDSGVVE